MATVNYYLKGARSDKNIKNLEKSAEGREFIKKYENTKLQIILMVSSNGKRMQVYTKRRIAPRYWDKGKQEYNPMRYRVHCAENNKWLHDLKDEAAKLADDRERNGMRITLDDLRELIERKIRNKPNKKGLEEVFNLFLVKHTTPQGNSLKPLTIKKYEGFYNHLTNFADDNKLKPDFDIFTSDFILKFKNYLQSNVGLSDTSVVKYIKTAKVFIRYLFREKIIRHFDLTEYKTSTRPGEIYVVPLEKVIHMQESEINDKKLSQVRDVFCFICWTGQRYSDVERLSWDDIIHGSDGSLFWDLTTTKTQSRIQVPIISYANDILMKYQGYANPLPQYSNQKMNKYLKELGKYLVWNWMIKKIAYFKGKPKEEYVPFYEVLTTHVGRKSFITNSLLLDIPERVVKEVSGHKDEKSFQRYVKLAESYKTQKIQEGFSRDSIKKYLGSIKT